MSLVPIYVPGRVPSASDDDGFKALNSVSSLGPRLSRSLASDVGAQLIENAKLTAPPSRLAQI